MIRLQLFTPEMTGDAVRVLARAFVTNPLHVAAFGSHQLTKNEAFFQVGLRVMKGPKLMALDGTRIVGQIHWVEAPTAELIDQSV